MEGMIEGKGLKGVKGKGNKEKEGAQKNGMGDCEASIFPTKCLDVL